jgi:hypothetical protein
MIGQSIRLGWAESERRLYPLATTSPARYEQAIRLVRAVADGLRATDSVDALLVQWTDATSIVATAASEHGLAIGDLPVEHIAGAAFALRAGELSAAEQQRRQREAIEEARTAGLSWVTLQERGDLGAGLIDPFHSIEMHVPTGLAIVTTVEMDPSTGGPNHVLAVAALDPATGGLIDADPGVADWTEHRESSELAAARQALVELIEVRVANDG